MFDRSVDVHVANLRKKLGHEINGLESDRLNELIGHLLTLTRLESAAYPAFNRVMP